MAPTVYYTPEFLALLKKNSIMPNLRQETARRIREMRAALPKGAGKFDWRSDSGLRLALIPDLSGHALLEWRPR